jgi:hypothetical protein
MAPMAAARGARTVAAMITKILCLLATMAATTAVAAASASADSGVYSNETPIDIPDSGDASVYPSTIDVGGLNGRIRDVTVTLRDFSHSGPEDVDILLVSPDGDAMTLMSDACGQGFEHYSFTFTRYAADYMHAGPAVTCGDFLYKPSEFYTGTPPTSTSSPAATPTAPGSSMWSTTRRATTAISPRVGRSASTP